MKRFIEPFIGEIARWTNPSVEAHNERDIFLNFGHTCLEDKGDLGVLNERNGDLYCVQCKKYLKAPNLLLTLKLLKWEEERV